MKNEKCADHQKKVLIMVMIMLKVIADKIIDRYFE